MTTQEWRGTTAAGRAATRRGQLIDAALELIGEKGIAGLTVRELHARAGLHPRYFYESFADLDKLLATIHDELVAETVRRATVAIDAAEPEEPAKTRAAVTAMFGYLTDDPRRIQLLLSEALGHPALAARRRDLVRAVADGMATQAAAFYGIPTDARLLRSTTYLLAGGLAELLIAWQNGTISLSVAELIDDAAALVSGTGDAARAIAAARSEDTGGS